MNTRGSFVAALASLMVILLFSSGCGPSAAYKQFMAESATKTDAVLVDQRKNSGKQTSMRVKGSFQWVEGRDVRESLLVYTSGKENQLMLRSIGGNPRRFGRLVMRKPAGPMPWEEAEKFCQSLTYAGWSNWQVPRVPHLTRLLPESLYPVASLPEGSHWFWAYDQWGMGPQPTEFVVKAGGTAAVGRQGKAGASADRLGEKMWVACHGLVSEMSFERFAVTLADAQEDEARGKRKKASDAILPVDLAWHIFTREDGPSLEVSEVRGGGVAVLTGSESVRAKKVIKMKEKYTKDYSEYLKGVVAGISAVNIVVGPTPGRLSIALKEFSNPEKRAMDYAFRSAQNNLGRLKNFVASYAESEHVAQARRDIVRIEAEIEAERQRQAAEAERRRRERAQWVAEGGSSSSGYDQGSTGGSSSSSGSGGRSSGSSGRTSGVKSAYDGGYKAANGTPIFIVRCNNGNKRSVSRNNDGSWQDQSSIPSRMASRYNNLSLNALAEELCR